MTNKAATRILNQGGIGILATDTLYGLVGRATSQQAVFRINQLKQRPPDKPYIILIGAFSALSTFGVKLNQVGKTLIDKLWPGPVSIILPMSSPGAFKKFDYLHLGRGTLTFRWPVGPRWLVKLLQESGPLVAPSANPAGQKPAQTITQAEKYFGGKVDFYLNGGRNNRQASTIVAIQNDKILLVRA